MLTSSRIFIIKIKMQKIKNETAMSDLVILC